jgi:1-acyl-sn-glycerol-3-phosphate acyltransferase
VSSERFTLAYRVVMAVVRPVIAWWGRLVVVGLEHLPETGPVVVLANHDSHWDPLVAGVAARSRRQIHALAKQSLWKNRIVGAVLDGMRQIPIERGAGDAGALDKAIAHLRDGECIGIFPEGTISLGQVRRIRSGAARLAAAVPAAALVGLAVSGTVDMVRFPRRPRLRVEFVPAPRRTDGQDTVTLVESVMARVRELAPVAPAGRHPGRPRRLFRRQAAARLPG